MSQKRWSASHSEANPSSSARVAQPRTVSHRSGRSPGTEKSNWGRAKPTSMTCASVGAVLECVMNVSEGRDEAVIATLETAAGSSLLDVHADGHHNRVVLTLAGPDVEGAARAVSVEATARIDLARHHGVHP